MINGNSVNVQFAEESSFGTLTTPDTRIEVTSESLSYDATKTSEGLLTGGIGPGKNETMSVAASGSISTLAKPTVTGFFLKQAIGSDTVTANDDLYDHVFTPVGNGENDFLPSVSFTIDRKAGVLAYTGMTANTIGFTASAGDRLALEVAYLGKTEVSGTIQTLTATSKNEGAFKFHQASVKFDSNTVDDITNIQFNYNNNLDNDKQTTDTGLYHKRPQPGQRECTVSFDMIYASSAETIRTSKFKTDAVVAVEILFEDASGNALKFELPQAQISEMGNATATGADTLTQSMTVSAIDNATAFVKVTLTNDKSSAY